MSTAVNMFFSFPLLFTYSIFGDIDKIFAFIDLVTDLLCCFDNVINLWCNIADCFTYAVTCIRYKITKIVKPGYISFSQSQLLLLIKALKFLIIQFIPRAGTCRLRDRVAPVTSQNHSHGSGILGRGSCRQGKSGFGGCIKRDLFITVFIFFAPNLA